MGRLIAIAVLALAGYYAVKFIKSIKGGYRDSTSPPRKTGGTMTGRLIIYRNSSGMGMAVPVHVYIDGNSIGKVRNGSRIYADLTPGQHHLALEMNNKTCGEGYIETEAGCEQTCSFSIEGFDFHAVFSGLIPVGSARNSSKRPTDGGLWTFILIVILIIVLWIVLPQLQLVFRFNITPIR